MAFMDPLMFTQIKFEAICIASAENRDFDGRLADVMTPEHTKAAIRKYFSDEPEWREDLLEPAYAMYLETEAMEEMVRDRADISSVSYAGLYELDRPAKGKQVLETVGE